MSATSTPLMLGGHAFQAVGFSFSDLSRETEADWAKIEVVGRESALHWTGPKGQDMTIKGAIFPRSLGGMASLDALRADASAGRVMTLVTGAGDVLGRYVLEKVSEEMTHLGPDATPGKVAHTLKLRRASGPSGGGSFDGVVAGLASGLGGLAAGGPIAALAAAAAALKAG